MDLEQKSTQIDTESEFGGEPETEFIQDTSAKILTLGTISEELQALCVPGKRYLPKILQGKSAICKKRVDLLLNGIVQYTTRVHPSYWIFLLNDKGNCSKGVIDVNPDHFQNDSAKLTSNSGISQINVKEVNWYAVWNLIQTEFAKMSESRDWKKVVTSIWNFTRMAKNGRSQEGKFGMIICGLLVKLLDARSGINIPKKSNRERLLGEEILANYACLNKKMWRKRLALNEKYLPAFPAALDEMRSGPDMELDVETDEDESDGMSVVYRVSKNVLDELPAVTTEPCTGTADELNKYLIQNARHCKELDLYKSKVQELEGTIRKENKIISDLKIKLHEEETGNNAILQITNQVPKEFLIPVLNLTAKVVVGLFEKRQQNYPELEVADFFDQVLQSVSASGSSVSWDESLNDVDRPNIGTDENDGTCVMDPGSENVLSSTNSGVVFEALQLTFQNEEVEGTIQEFGANEDGRDVERKRAEGEVVVEFTDEIQVLPNDEVEIESDSDTSQSNGILYSTLSGDCQAGNKYSVGASPSMKAIVTQRVEAVQSPLRTLEGFQPDIPSPIFSPISDYGSSGSAMSRGFRKKRRLCN